MSDHSKQTLDVVRAAMALVERDVDLGLLTAEQLLALPRSRFAAVERKQIAARLKAERDWSNREIAEELGVSHDTINRDLGGANRPPKPKKVRKNNGGGDANRPPPCDDECRETKKVFLIQADIAARAAV